MTDDNITIALNTVERSIARRAVSVALNTYSEDAADREDAEELHRLLDSGVEGYEATKAQWNLLLRILSYDDVRGEIGTSRVEYLRSKLVRRIDGINV